MNKIEIKPGIFWVGGIDWDIRNFKILETEKKSMERFEEGDVYWPMVHVGS